MCAQRIDADRVFVVRACGGRTGALPSHPESARRAGRLEHVKKAVRPLAVMVLIYPLLMLAIGWVAVAQGGFERAYTAPIVAASLAALVLAIGYWRRKIWFFAAGAGGIILFCPSPLGLFPMTLGLVLLIAFGFVIARASEEGNGQW